MAHQMIGTMQSRERVPVPSHRHAMPSGPWPWMDLDSEETDGANDPPLLNREDWHNYPQSLFPNWTFDQVRRSSMMIKAGQSANCGIYVVDVKAVDGCFEGPTEIAAGQDEKELWDMLQARRPPGLRARAFFLENITRPVLQMLGSIYNIEPFFFSSSLNWIPSRYQENVEERRGDHITVTLTFLRPAKVGSLAFPNGALNTPPLRADTTDSPIIDTLAPLILRSPQHEKVLVLDTLAVHVIREVENSTIISYHPNPEGHISPTRGLHARFRLAGESVYWQDISKHSTDPTFLVLVILWHAVYAWDEALEHLYSHICLLEGVIDTKNVLVARELHIIRAHLLHYGSLLTDFRKSVQFIFDTRHPAIVSYPEEIQKGELELLQRECDTLLSEIERLEMFRHMQDKRMQNAIALTFSIVNLEDSKRTQDLMEATTRDSEAMKVVSYITAVFFPAIFVASIFGMNIPEFNPGTKASLMHYFVAMVSLTFFTIWIIVAFQSKYLMPGYGKWVRFLWPITIIRIRMGRMDRDKMDRDKMDRDNKD